MTSRSNRRSSRYSVLGSALWGMVGLVPFAGQAQPPGDAPIPPTVIFLLDTHRSMQEFPTWLPEAFTPGHSPTTGVKQGDLGFNDPQYGHFINTGCSDPALVTEMSWFDKDSEDPSVNGSIARDTDADLHSTFFEANRFYHSRGRRVSWAGNNEDAPSSMNADLTGLSGSSQTDAGYTCKQVWNRVSAYTSNPAVLNECVACLQSKGWWRGPITPGSPNGGWLGPPQVAGEPPLPAEARRKWVVSGGVLNVRPPKFVAARRALKDVIQTANGMRMGVAALGEGWDGFDPPLILRDVQPRCSYSYPILDERALDRPFLSKAVNRALFRNHERSTGEALFGLGGYFSSQGRNFQWRDWFAQPVGTPTFGWPGLPSGGTYDNPFPPFQSGASFAGSSEEWLKQHAIDPVTGRVLTGQRFEQGGDNRTVCFANQVSAIVLVTGAEPRSEDNSVPITRMMAMLVAQRARHPTGELLTFDPSNPETNPHSGGVNYCDLVGATKADCDYTDYNWPTGLAVDNRNFMDDVAFFLAHTDLRTADKEAGQEPQSLGTQSVRTYVVGYGSSHPMLQSIALAGEGSFHRADDAASLRGALEKTLAQIRAAAP